MRRDSDKPNRQHTRFDSLDLRPRRLEIFHTKTDGRRRLRLPSVCGCFAVAGKPAGSPSADAFRCRTGIFGVRPARKPFGSTKVFAMHEKAFAITSRGMVPGCGESRDRFDRRRAKRFRASRKLSCRPWPLSCPTAGRVVSQRRRASGRGGQAQACQAASAKPSAARRPRPEVFV